MKLGTLSDDEAWAEIREFFAALSPSERIRLYQCFTAQIYELYAPELKPKTGSSGGLDFPDEKSMSHYAGL